MYSYVYIYIYIYIHIYIYIYMFVAVWARGPELPGVSRDQPPPRWPAGPVCGRRRLRHPASAREAIRTKQPS